MAIITLIVVFGLIVMVLKMIAGIIRLVFALLPLIIIFALVKKFLLQR